MRHLPTALAAAALLAASTCASAHPGGLNAEGCHNDRKNGGYHCHRAGARTSPRPAPSNFEPGTPRHSWTPGSGIAPGAAYRNCSEARAAGAAPVRRGDPGYGSHLDRDNDGIGCE